jgi:hypothetical protein
MTGSPTDNPDEFQTGPSSPELIDIDEIVGLDNPETAMPQARSQGVFQLNQRQSEHQGEKVCQTP